MIATSPETVSPFTSGSLRLVKPTQETPAGAQRARELFLQAWALMEMENRSEEQSEKMINAAHASRYYWEEAGTALNRAVAEWLLSRCYVGLSRAEPALYHARRCEALASQAEENATLVRAYAQEALARAYLLARHPQVAGEALSAAESLAGRLSSNDAFYIGQELKALRAVLNAA
jgi:hypothetical protein